MSRCIYAALFFSRLSCMSHVQRRFAAKTRKEVDWIFAKPARHALKQSPQLQRFPKLVSSREVGSIKSSKSLVGKAPELLKPTAGLGPIEEVYREKLQFTAAEWHNVTQSYIYPRLLKDIPLFNSKVDHLLSLGFSIEDIKGHLRILTRSLQSLQTRVQIAKDIDPCIRLTIIDLNTDMKKYRPSLHRRKKIRECLRGFPDKFEAVADLLGVSVDEVSCEWLVRDSSVCFLHNSIQMLLTNGVSRDDILCHFNIIRRGPIYLQKGLAKMKEMGFTKPCLTQLVSILDRHKVSSRRQIGRWGLHVLAKLLDCDTEDLRSHRSELKNIVLKGKHQQKKVVEYLVSQGFLAKDIAQCPLLIGHDLSILRSYVDTYKDREEYEELALKFQGDSSKLLNWIQYLIERDINFTSYEAIAEEEEADM